MDDRASKKRRPVPESSRSDETFLGPAQPPELHHWPSHVIESLHPDMLDSLASSLDDTDLILTTSYSGIGSAELGLQMFLKALQRCHVHATSHPFHQACRELLQCLPESQSHELSGLPGLHEGTVACLV